MARCPYCGSEVSGDEALCPHCGIPIKIEAGRETHYIKRNLTILLVCVAVVIFAAVIFLVSSKTGERIYAYPEFGFEVRAPAGVDVEEYKNGGVLLRFEGGSIQDGNFFYIRIDAFERWNTVEERVSAMKKLMELAGGRVISEGWRKVAGVQAYEIVTRHGDGPKVKIIYLHTEKYAYSFEYSSQRYDELYPVFEEVLNSFKLS